jgi:small subunit ribosomal protein S11e
MCRVFLGYRKLANKKVARSGLRWTRNVGLGFKTPVTAIKVRDHARQAGPPCDRIEALFLQATYIDKKCPFTGNVSIRGRILKGIVTSTKMNRTVVIRRDYLRFIRKYRRYEKRHKTVSAHVSPAFLVKDGDVVTVGQCRPLSKTVRFNVLKVESATEAGALRAKKTFRVYVLLDG